MHRLLVVLLLTMSPALAEVPRVATDIPPVQSLVALVMAGVGTPDLAFPAGLSPHDVALRPSDARLLSQAELVVMVAPGLSPAMDRTVDALARDRVLTLLDVPGTTVLGYRDGAVFGGNAPPATAADLTGGNFDPHAWLDPENAMLWLTAIATALAEIDPENAIRYTENADRAVIGLRELRSTIGARMEPLRDRLFVVFHDAFSYFESRFGLQAAGAIALSDGGAPGPRRLAGIGDVIADDGIRCVFAEPQFDPDLVETLIPDSGARVGVIDPLGMELDPGPDLYADLLRGVAEAFETCLVPFD